MNTRLAVVMIALTAIASPKPSSGQERPATVARTLVRSSQAFRSTTYNPSARVMVESRARTLGTRLSASRTRYFSVADVDLIGKSPAEVMERLSPAPVGARDGVRAMEILVDVRRPTALHTRGQIPTDIGTATVSARGVRRFESNATIVALGAIRQTR